MTASIAELRRQAVSDLRFGMTPQEVATKHGRSLSWVYKCQQLNRSGGKKALEPKSHAPKHHAKALPKSVHEAIRTVREALEAEAEKTDRLCYIGSRAIRNRMKRTGITPLPSLSTIERELKLAGLVQSRKRPAAPEVEYPHLTPRHVGDLVQADIVPHYQQGGRQVSCFNAIDTVSRYPTGMQFATKQASNAAAFLLHVWQELGVPTYTQLDNESCFNGGVTHKYVLGQVVRLGLWAGTQIVFSPYYHPKSNSTVERFHQEYNRHTWARESFDSLESVQKSSLAFFSAYRQSDHHRMLDGATPQRRHAETPARPLPPLLPALKRLPLYAGRIHFMRKVTEAQQVQVLNVLWDIPHVAPNTGVWGTLDLTTSRAALSIFDTAPDAPFRHCLAHYPFPLKEQVLRRPLPARTTHQRLPKAFHDVMKVVSIVKESFFSMLS